MKSLTICPLCVPHLPHLAFTAHAIVAATLYRVTAQPRYGCITSVLLQCWILGSFVPFLVMLNDVNIRIQLFLCGRCFQVVE